MSNIKKILAIDKVFRMFEVIKANGGIKGSFVKYFRMDELKMGKLVGVDKFGNRYYENNFYFHGRNRWVEYADKTWLDYDGSMIDPEWYGWIHYKTDLLPNNDPSRPKYPWMMDHVENPSGTKDQYTPYSTTVPKIQAWVPPKK